MASQSVAVRELRAKHVARLLHELVAMSPAFDYARFDSAGTIGDFALGDLPEWCAAMGSEQVPGTD